MSYEVAVFVFRGRGEVVVFVPVEVERGVVFVAVVDT
jgi:hypothetical protein